MSKSSFQLLLVSPVAALVLAACSGAATSDPTPASTSASAAPSDSGALAAGSTSDAVAPGTADTARYDFPTGPAVIVPIGYEPPADHVPSTGAHLPVNGKPTLVFVDAIWCPPCALTRPYFHEVRQDYQDEVNVVVLDFDSAEDSALAEHLGARAHPGWAVVAPDSDEVVERRFGPLNEPTLREFFDGIKARYAAGS